MRCGVWVIGVWVLAMLIAFGGVGVESALKIVSQPSGNAAGSLPDALATASNNDIIQFDPSITVVTLDTPLDTLANINNITIDGGANKVTITDNFASTQTLNFYNVENARVANLIFSKQDKNTLTIVESKLFTIENCVINADSAIGIFNSEDISVLANIINSISNTGVNSANNININIMNNQITAPSGIELANTATFNILSNSIISTTTGITALSGSSNGTMEKNIITSSGTNALAFLAGSSNVKISNNTLTQGAVFLQATTDFIVQNNSISGTNLQLVTSAINTKILYNTITQLQIGTGTMEKIVVIGNTVSNKIVVDSSHNLTVQSNFINNGIALSNSNYFTITENKIVVLLNDPTNHGIYLSSSSNFLISYNEINGKYSGITMSSGILGAIEHNIFSITGDYSIAASGSINVTITSNTLNGGLLAIDYAQNLVVNDNTLTGSIAVSSSSPITINNNSFSNLTLSYSSALLIKNNTISNGISVSGSSILTFQSNTIASMVNGLVCSGSSALRIEGNLITVPNTQYSGIALDTSSDFIIFSNTITGYSGVSLNNAGSGSIDFNVINANRNSLEFANGAYSLSINSNALGGSVSLSSIVDFTLFNNTIAGEINCVDSNSVTATTNRVTSIAASGSLFLLFNENIIQDSVHFETVNSFTAKANTIGGTLTLTGSIHFEISNNVLNDKSIGSRLTGVTAYGLLANNQILRASQGIVLDSGTHDVTFSENTIDSVKGFVISDGSNFTITSNNIKATTMGLSATKTITIDIIENKFTTQGLGIELKQVFNSTIAQNDIGPNAVTGIVSEKESSMITAYNNTIAYSCSGISISTSSNSTVMHNTFSLVSPTTCSSTTALLASQSNNILAISNTIPSTSPLPLNGFLFTSVDLSSAISNDVNGIIGVGIAFISSTNSVINLNSITGSGSGIVLISSRSISVSNNFIKSNIVGIDIVNSKNNWLYANVISYSGSWGLHVNCTEKTTSTYACSNAFESNLIGFNNGGGIVPVATNSPVSKTTPNPPVITTITNRGGLVTVNSTLAAGSNFANQHYVFEYFANNRCDPRGYGQGEMYIGRSLHEASSTGTVRASFTYNLNESALSANGSSIELSSACYLTITSTLLTSDTTSIQLGDVTSRFSICRSRCRGSFTSSSSSSSSSTTGTTGKKSPKPSKPHRGTTTTTTSKKKKNGKRHRHHVSSSAALWNPLSWLL